MYVINSYDLDIENACAIDLKFYTVIYDEFFIKIDIPWYIGRIRCFYVRLEGLMTPINKVSYEIEDLLNKDINESGSFAEWSWYEKYSL